MRTTPATASARHLPVRTKLGYGTAEFGFVAVEVLVELYLLKFYNTVLGLAPAWTALAMAIAVIWDAVSDPLMGALSDRTRHPAGRRRPWFLPGAIGLAASVALIFHPPAIREQFWLFLFLLGGYLSITTAMTVASVPHIALAGELSFDRDERTSIFGYRRLFTTLGLLAGTILPAAILHALGPAGGPDQVTRSRGLAALVLGLPIILSAWISFRATRGLDRGRPIPGGRRVVLRDLLREQLSTLRNRAFLPLLASFLVAGIGRSLNASLALYFYEYRLRLTEPQTVFGILLPFFLCILASVPFWVLLSRRVGKKGPGFWGILALGLFVSVAYPLLLPDRMTVAVLVSVIGGALAGSIILYESLVADVVDLDELRTGRNREGVYFGVWKMGVKLSRALGLLLTGVLLQFIGFDEKATLQTGETLHSLALLFGPGVGLFLVAGALIFRRLPLTDARHRRVQALLVRRREWRERHRVG